MAWLFFLRLLDFVMSVLPREITCRFLVNWYRSRRCVITFGVGQGWFLAPHLVLLALDSVYRMIQAREDIRGVPIAAGGRSTELNVLG